MPNKAKENETIEQQEDLATDAAKSSTKSEAKTKAKKPAKVSKTQQEIERLQTELDQLKEQQLRQFAEFDNFRKRTQREKAEIYQNATADCVLLFINVLDNLERALESSGGESDIRTGVEMIVTQFQDALAKLDVHEIPAQGEPFDPEVHNAINQVEDENFGDNTVCQVFQKGYQLGDKVIRHAMVVVANP